MTSTWLHSCWRCFRQLARPRSHGFSEKHTDTDGRLLLPIMYGSSQNSQRNFSSTSIPASQRIYVLGIGNLGRLIAHALATQLNPPPITLLFHRETLLTEWEQAERAIELTTKGIASRSTAYDVELLDPEDGKNSHADDKIYNLIITTKATQTIQALRPIANRIDPSSILLFAQNGMGVVSKLTTALGPEYEAFSVVNSDNKKPSNLTPQPRYLAAIASHGLYSTGPFRSVHAGLGSITLGQTSLIPSPASKGTSQSTLLISNPNYLLNYILNSSLLSATAVTPSELYLLQLEKLAANAIINPLTALFRLKNGEIFSHPPLIKLLRLLLNEISAVFIHHLNRISSLDKLTNQERFSPQRLETSVKNVADKTAENSSSMLQDMRAGRETEIEFINGWVVQTAREVGVPAVINERIVGLVKEGRIMEMQSVEECIL